MLTYPKAGSTGRPAIRGRSVSWGALGSKGNTFATLSSMVPSLPHGQDVSVSVTGRGTTDAAKKVGTVLRSEVTESARTTVTADTPVSRVATSGSSGAGELEGETDGVPLGEGVADRVSPTSSGVMDSEGVAGLLGVWLEDADDDPVALGDPVWV